MRVIKRSGTEAEFDKSKIKIAITKANSNIEPEYQITEEQIDSVVKAVCKECKDLNRACHVEEIQDFVENALMRRKFYILARTYVRYRYDREKLRVKNTTDEAILALLDRKNEEIKQENSNKNPTINSTQRDYMAGEVSKDLTRRILLPKDIVDAHDQGIIHFHDADYFAQHMHNCFHSKTRFVTADGIREFRDFSDGQLVEVMDKDGVFRLATVRRYGKQPMQRVVFSTGIRQKEVVCTANHRWILDDGTVTTDLRVGDRLLRLKDSTQINMVSKRDYEMFALGVLIGDGCDHQGCNHHEVRLCGDKTKWADVMSNAGYRLRPIGGSNDIMCESRGYKKQKFLDGEGWKYLSIRDKKLLFYGLKCMDGSKNRLATADDRVANMIRDISAVCGWHISSETCEIGDTNYKTDRRLYYFYLTNHQAENSKWKVISIIQEHTGTAFDAWCVEEPITHSFTLAGGMITGNCDLLNLDDMLQNGTVITSTMIEKPHTFSTACNIATQIIAQVASNQYGGQTITLSHLAPFVDETRKNYRERYGDMGDEFVERLVHEDIERGIQTIQYQILTLLTSNGQTPFITVYMDINEVEDGQTRKDLADIIEEVLKQRIQGVKNAVGVWVTPTFPKLIYALDENNINPDSEYYYLTELAAKCTAKRMVPDYISAKVMRELKGDIYPSMGCRSYLTPDRFTDAGIGNVANAKNYIPGKHRYYGRFNQGVVTINLPDVALSSGGDMDKFWGILNERLELCKKALLCRHERLKGTVSDVAPILWQYGALARLEKGETIDRLLYNGYSTISLGYAGLYECVKYMTGVSHTDEAGKPFGLEVMQAMNDACAKWKAEYNIDFSLYGTPLESTTYKFAKCLQKRFGIIPGVTDKNYITNSYHVHVTEPIDAFTKLKFESEFQALSPGGAISYVEVPNMQKNIPAVMEVIRYIYDTILYAELNTKCDYCQVCGFDGEIQIVNDGDKLVWECPNCHNRDESKMNVVRRTCGYLGSSYWNQGRTQEIAERVLHL